MFSLCSLSGFLLHRGWGLRCLDDVPNGGFICIYAGQLLSEEGADQVKPINKSINQSTDQLINQTTK